MYKVECRLVPIVLIMLTGLVSCEKDDIKVLPTDILSLWDFKGYEINGIFENNPDSIAIDLYIGSIYSNGNDLEGASPFRNYWGRFKLDGNKILFQDFKVTNILTENDSVLFYNVEKRYLNSLKECYQYKIEDDTLMIEFGSDSFLIFTESSNTIYQDSFGFSALYNGIKWESDSVECIVVVDSYGTTSSFYSTFNGVPILKYSDGNLYDLSMKLYYPPKAGTYSEAGSATVRAYSFIEGDPNTNRSESNYGYIKIRRISRKFISGEFGFHMVSDGYGLPEEFEITQGEFKSVLRDISDNRLYIQY